MPPLVLVAVAWTAGLLAAYHCLVPMGVDPVILLLLALIPLTAILLWREDRLMRVYAACTLAFMLGAFRYQTYGPDLQDPSFVAHYNGRDSVVLEGVVQDYPDVRDTWTNLTLSADTLSKGDLTVQVRGRVLVRAARYPEFRYGDRLRVSGALEVPPEFDGFSYRDYLARRDTYSLIWQPRIERLDSGHGLAIWTAIYAVKDRARTTLARLLPEPESSLLQGILLGIRSGIPADLADDFDATGTSHLIVISGANIALVVAFVSTGCAWLLAGAGRTGSSWSASCSMCCWWAPTRSWCARRDGWPVCHCAVPGTALHGLRVAVRLAAPAHADQTHAALGRRLPAQFRLHAESDPLYATLSKPAAARAVQIWLSAAGRAENPFPRRVSGGDSGCASADHPAARLPLWAACPHCAVGQPVGPPGTARNHGSRRGNNARRIGTAVGAVGRIIAWVPWLGLAYTTAVVRWLAALPFASVDVTPSAAAGLVIGLGLVLGAVWLVRRHRVDPGHLRSAMASQVPSKIFLGASLTGAFLASLALLQLPDGRLHVAFLDVGQVTPF